LSARNTSSPEEKAGVSEKMETAGLRDRAADARKND